MITRSESGLGAGDYASIQAAMGDLSAEILIQRLGPVWTAHPNAHPASDDNFDADIVDGYIVMATRSGTDIVAWSLADETGGDENWASCSVNAGVSDLDDDIELSIGVTGTTVRIFYYNGTKIRYTECADIAVGTFGAPQDVATVANVQHLGAVSTTMVHYNTLTSENNRRLHYASFNGSWSTTSSDIYWPFAIDSLDAEDIGDADVIALATQMPPLVGSRAVGTEVSVEVDTVYGIVTFLVANGRYSDHFEFDVHDRVEAAHEPSRANLRLSYVNSLLFAAYTRVGSTGESVYTRLAFTRSKDGKLWEFPDLYNVAGPGVILPRTDYLYLVSHAATTRSPCCVWGGQTPVEQDVTSYVTELSSRSAELRQSTVRLADAASQWETWALDSTLVRNTTERLQLVQNLGFQVSGDTIRMTVSTEDITRYTTGTRLPTHEQSLTAQDRLARLNRAVSDHAAEYPGMEVGRDPFEDPTDTGWGGMQFMASYKPSWKADDGVLNLVANNKEGLVVSTFIGDALNTKAQMGFILQNNDTGEYAGVAFRVLDKDNFFYVAYHPDEEQIILYRRRGQRTDDETYIEDTIDYVDTSSGGMSLGWAAAVTTYHYLMFVVRYGLCYGYYSSDGITWTELSWDGSSAVSTELPGYPGECGDTNEYPVWSGKTGLIGWGYSDEDTPADPDPWSPTPWYPPMPPANWGVLLLSGSALARSWDFFPAEDPSWENMDPDSDFTGTIAGLAIGPSNQIYVTTTTGLWYCGNVLDSTPSWQCLMTDADATTEAGVTGEFMSVQVAPDGTVYAPWQAWGYNDGLGYFSGNAGGVSYTAFALYDPPGPNSNCKVRVWDTSATFGCWIDPGGTVYMAGCSGSCGYAPLWQTGNAYTYYGTYNEQYGLCYQDGYYTTYGDYQYQGATYLRRGTGTFGMDVLFGSVLYIGASAASQQDYVMRDGTALATPTAVWGEASVVAGRAIYSRNRIDEIIWVTMKDLSGMGTPSKVVVWTSDAFTNWHDKTGDYHDTIEKWTGATGSSGGDGNAAAYLFQYTDADYP